MLIALTQNSLDLTILGIAFGVVLILRTSRILHNKLTQLPLPPGPKPWPILGNISDFPKTHEGRFWAAHREKYGNLLLFLRETTNSSYL